MRFGARELILVTAMVALLVCSYFFVFRKSNAKRMALKAEIDARRTALVNLKKATAGIDDLGRKIEELQQAISFFEKKLPQEKEIDQILRRVTEIANANSLPAKSWKTLKAEVGPSYSEQPIQLTLCGDFNGFYSFLLKLEKEPRITRVSQMRLEKIDGRDGEMSAQVTLSIFFEPDSASASAR